MLEPTHPPLKSFVKGHPTDYLLSKLFPQGRKFHELLLEDILQLCSKHWSIGAFQWRDRDKQDSPCLFFFIDRKELRMLWRSRHVPFHLHLLPSSDNNHTSSKLFTRIYLLLHTSHPEKSGCSLQPSHVHVLQKPHKRLPERLSS